MKKSLFLFLTVFILLISLFPQSQADGKLTVPELKIVNGNLNSAKGNDIYLMNDPIFDKLGGQIWSTQTQYNLYSTDQTSRNLVSSNVQPNVRKSLTDQYLQFSNRSNEPMKLSYSASYYNLNNVNTSVDSLIDVPISPSTTYNVKLNLTQNMLYGIGFHLVSSGTSVSITFTVVSPSGVSSSTTRSYATLIDEFLTFVGPENGSHILQIRSGSSLIFSSFAVYTNLKITDTQGGFLESLTGTKTTIKTFRLLPSNSSKANSLYEVKLGGTTFVNQELEVYARSVNLMGNIRMRVFVGHQYVFGASLPRTETTSNDQPVYVSIVITPPNEKDPFIASEKAKLGLPKGFDVQYSFWGSFLEIPQIVPNLDTTVQPFGTPVGNLFRFSTTSQVVLGLNGTDRVYIDVIDLSGKTPQFTLSYISNDVLNSRTDKPIVLPAGNYLLRVYDNKMDGSSSFRFSVFGLSTVFQGSSVTVSTKYQQIKYIFLPTNFATKDRFNVTYLDHLNMSVSYTFDLYSLDGSRRIAHSATYDQYANKNNPNFVQNNSTEFGSTSLTSSFNLRGNLIRIQETGNTKWNSTQITPTVTKTNDPAASSSISLRRYNYFAKQTTDLKTYKEMDLTNGLSEFLNKTKTTIFYLFNLKTSDSGYYLKIKIQNMSSTLNLLVSGSQSWFSGITGTMVVENNFTYYETVLEFNTAMLSNIAVSLQINLGVGGNTKNGTLSVELVPISYQSLGAFLVNPLKINDISLYSKVSQNTNTVPASGSGIDSNLLLYGGIGLGVVSLGAVIAILYKKGLLKRTP